MSSTVAIAAAPSSRANSSGILGFIFASPMAAPSFADADESCLLLPGLRNRHEAVADAAHRDEKFGVGRRVLQIPAQAHDKVVDGARVGVLVQTPHLLEDLLAAHVLVAVLDQITQQRGFHERQLDLARWGSQLHGMKIQRAAVELKDLVLRWPDQRRLLCL